MPTAQKKSEELERTLLEWNRDGVPILTMQRRIEAAGSSISRQTIYNIFTRYGVKKSNADIQFRKCREEANLLSRKMVRYMNGSVDRDSMLSAVSTFEAKWPEPGDV